MSFFRRLTLAVVSSGALLISGPAAADDSALNKEGSWTVGRGDAESEVCMASIITEASVMFILRAAAGEVAFVVGAKQPMRRGKKGALKTDAYSFDFEPSFSDDRALLFSDGPLNDRALAALKLASGIAVEVDGRSVLDADVAGTGIENAIDGVIACSKGERGWWGPGVAVDHLAAKSAEPASERPLHKDGLWTLAATGDGCSAAVRIQDDGGMVLIAVGGGRDIMLGLGADGGFKRGRKGRLEIDAYGLDFKPAYDGKDYMQLDTFLDSRALVALRQAKSIRVTVDGREVVQAELEGSGLPDVMASLEACARGEAGWWGKGATP